MSANPLTDNPHDELFKLRHGQITAARNAILEELKRRFKEGDKAVNAALQTDLHRWYRPQPNYFYGSGEMACPVCKTGKLGYRRAGYNGHVHARCTTENCVCWME